MVLINLSDIFSREHVRFYIDSFGQTTRLVSDVKVISTYEFYGKGVRYMNLPASCFVFALHLH